MHPFELRVQHYISTHHLLRREGVVLVALSGGADSVALLLMLRAMGFEVRALHCNFHLRGEESDRDEAFVTALCHTNNVPLDITHFATADYAQAHGISIEMAARNLRYEWFASMLTHHKAQAIAVAHHTDDQAETLLLNLTRGTGLRGLCGMSPRHGSIVRPLLCLTRADITSYLAETGQTYVTDSTNLEREAQRNVLRLDVMPQLQTINPQAHTHMAHTADILRQSLYYYKLGIQQALREIDATEAHLPIRPLLASPHPALLLHEWLNGRGYNAQQEADILAHAEAPSGAIYESPTHRLLRDRTAFICLPHEAFAPVDVVLPLEVTTTVASGVTLRTSLHDASEDLPRGPQYAWIDADLITAPLRIRRTRQGDTFHPFGMRGTKLVSDFLTNLKVSLFDKQLQLLVEHHGDILWLIGRRSDHRYRVTPTTHRILLIELL